MDLVSWLVTGLAIGALGAVAVMPRAGAAACVPLSGGSVGGLAGGWFLDRGFEVGMTGELAGSLVLTLLGTAGGAVLRHEVIVVRYRWERP